MVELFGEPVEAYEVEFVDEDGRTIAQVTLRADHMETLVHTS